MELLPHQEIAVRFALPRRRSYLALDPGLGKTPTAAVVTRSLGLPTVYVCPPFLVKNVQNEYHRWAPLLRVRVHGTLAFQDLRAVDVLIVPDSALSWEGVRGEIALYLALRDQPRTELWAFAGSLTREGQPYRGQLIVDEAHRFKETTAKRTGVLFGRPEQRWSPARTQARGQPARKEKPARGAVPSLVSLFERRMYLSGTPIPNRPLELYPLLASEAPETIDFMDRFQFGLRYCDGKKTHFGWDFKGATNIPELKARVQGGPWPFMLRQRKELLKLPPVIEEVFILSADMSPQLAKLDASVAEAYGTGGPDRMRRQLAEAQGVGEKDLHVATYRRLLGVEKVRPAAEYISALLDETDESILVVAYHVEVVQKLRTALDKWDPFVITGETPIGARQKVVDEFQSSKTRRLMLGNYVAMGVGFTLTKATRVLLVEYSWVPGENRQVIDRTHRIGQTKSVLAQYFAFQNSVDARQLNAILEKTHAVKAI